MPRSLNHQVPRKSCLLFELSTLADVDACDPQVVGGGRKTGDFLMIQETHIGESLHPLTQHPLKQASVIGESIAISWERDRSVRIRHLDQRILRWEGSTGPQVSEKAGKEAFQNLLTSWQH